MDMVTGKELVGTHWAHRVTGQRVVIKEQFRVGSDIESWVDLRNESNLSHMIQTDQLVRDYSRVYLEFQDSDAVRVLDQ